MVALFTSTVFSVSMAVVRKLFTLVCYHIYVMGEAPWMMCGFTLGVVSCVARVINGVFFGIKKIAHGVWFRVTFGRVCLLLGYHLVSPAVPDHQRKGWSRNKRSKCGGWGVLMTCLFSFCTPHYLDVLQSKSKMVIFLYSKSNTEQQARKGPKRGPSGVLAAECAPEISDTM